MNTNRLLNYVIGVMLSLTVQAQTVLPEDTLLVNRLLTEARLLPSNANYTLYFAREFVGVPYVPHTLEVNNEEQLVVNLRQMDCTTLVENVVALTLCMKRGQYTAKDFQNTLTQLRYRDGKISGYTSRLHYFTDWIADNAKLGMVEEIQSPNPPFTSVQTINLNYMSTHPQAYKALRKDASLIQTIKEKEKELSDKCSREIENIEELIQGRFPESLKSLFYEKGGLFPSPKEIHFSCSCPDTAIMCKHVAAVMYGIGVRLDEDPLQFFVLRGIDVEPFVTHVIEDKVDTMLKNAKKPTRRVLEMEDIEGLIGIL